jgi:cytidine deaminase
VTSVVPLPANQAQALMDQAEAGAYHSFSPYSQFAVGAALLMQDGTVIPGCNVENASYGLTLCAERTALVSAISQGHRQPVAIAVWAQITPHHAITPCGACRQMLSEWLPPSAPVVMRHLTTGELVQRSVAELLPHGFVLPSI